MSLTSLWRRLMDGNFRPPWPRRRAQRPQPGLRCRLAVEPLEDRRLLSIVRAGPEFRVNTFTSGGQSSPRMALDADGDFIISWESFGQDGSGDGIYAQRYDAAGAPQGGEFRVNTFTTNHQRSPSVAMNAGGDFVIAWHSYLQDSSSWGVYAQRYDAAGVPQSGEFRVNTTVDNSQFGPSVALDADGDFIIAWTSSVQDGSGYGVHAQAYDAAGAPQGGEFRVNTFTGNSQSGPSVAMDAGGDFVIAWHSRYQDGNGYGVYAQRYDPAGVPQGSEFRVNTFTTNGQSGPAVALDADGNFVIAWNSYGQDGSSNGVYAQAYDAAGAPQGGEFRVNTFTANSQSGPSVAMDAGGDFVIAWHSRYQDGNGYGVYAQPYDASGVPLSSRQLLVNTFTSGNQLRSTVAIDGDGDAVIAWQSAYQDGSGSGIYAQRIAQVVDLVVDNSDPFGFDLSGEWAAGGGDGVGHNDNVYVAFGESNLPTDIATWTINLSDGPGRYIVSATWFTNIDFPQLFTSAARYEVSDPAAGVIRGTALINQKQLPNDFTNGGSLWEVLGEFDIVGPTLQVRLFSSDDDQTYVVADAIHVERVGLLSTTAEIEVTENGLNVPDNNANISFGAAEFNLPVTKTFTISNVGLLPLTLTIPISVTGSVFTIATQPTLTTLNSGQSTAFTVQMNATTPGAASATVSFANNDSNESSFNFTVSGTVLPTRIIDDGDLEYSDSPASSFGHIAGLGREGDYRYTRLITGNDIAAWTFAVTRGQYRVSATWFDGRSGFDDTAPFTVFDGADSRGGRDLNQQLPPDDREFGGSDWEDVGVFNILGTTLTVQLRGDDPVLFVLADAILIERLGSVPGGPEIAVLDGTHDVNAGPPVDFGATQGNHPVDKVFTITNSGTATLEIGTITFPLGYEMVIGPSSAALAPNQTASFTLRLTAVYGGVKSGTVSIATNDSNENALTFNVTGTVLQSQIVDDDDVGYFHTGDFQTSPAPTAYGGDISYVYFQASPASTAFWTFNVTPGFYLIAATWFDTGGNTVFTSVAPYSVYDGGDFEGTFNLNQRNGPQDFFADGAWWESMGGSFNIGGTIVTVWLENVGTDGYLLADAVRLFRIGPPGNVESGSAPPSAPTSAGSLRDEQQQRSAVDEEMLATAYWDDEAEEVASVLAEDAGRWSSADLSGELATHEPTVVAEAEMLDLALGAWLEGTE